MTRFVIIGGSGFVGQWLVKRWVAEGRTMLVDDIAAFPDNNVGGFDYVDVDIRDEAALQRLRLSPNDVVIHLAANQYHLRPPRKGRKAYFFNTNVEGTRNILEAMEKGGCHRLVYFSTDMVYGKPDSLPVKTDHPKRPFGYYGASKWASETLCEAYREKGLNITIFRPRMIIGPGRLGVLKKLFRLIQWGLPVPLIGNGSNCYQMVSVFDVVEAICLAVQKGCPNKAYNLGSCNPPTVLSLMKALIHKERSRSVVLKTSGKWVKRVLGVLGAFGIEILCKEQYEIADEQYIVDTEETEKDLGWHPQFNDADMLQEAYRQYIELTGNAFPRK